MDGGADVSATWQERYPSEQDCLDDVPGFIAAVGSLLAGPWFEPVSEEEHRHPNAAPIYRCPFCEHDYNLRKHFAPDAAVLECCGEVGHCVQVNA